MLTTVKECVEESVKHTAADAVFLLHMVAAAAVIRLVCGVFSTRCDRRP